MFHEYKKPRTYRRNDLPHIYKNGAILLGKIGLAEKTQSSKQGIKDRARFTVYGRLGFEERDQIVACSKIIYEKYPEDFGEKMVNVTEVAPTLKTLLISETTFRRDANMFWSDIQGLLKVQFDKMKDVYNIAEGDMHIFYTYEKEEAKIAYHGYTIEGYLAVKKAVDQNKNICSCTYADFLRIQRRLKRNHAGNADGQNSAGYDLHEEEDSTMTTLPGEDEDIAMAVLTDRRRPMQLKLLDFLENHNFEEMLHFMQERITGQPELPKVVAGIYQYLDCTAHGKTCKSNILISAPSGCGKTETFRALRDYLGKHLKGFPVTQVDMTSITEEGFKGKDTADVVAELRGKGDGTGIGIVFMDEFDKKLIPSYTSQGNNVNAAIQSQLLTLIEGRTILFKEDEIDTTNTLFIGLGSFDECRKRREKKTGGLGFGAEASIEQSDHYHEISRDEMIELGASYELLGRFQILANYYRLSESALDKLIDKYQENAISTLGVRLVIMPQMRAELHALANGRYGCRMLENTIMDRAMELLPELLSKKDGKWRYVMVLDSDGKSQIVNKWIWESENKKKQEGKKEAEQE